MDVPTLFNRVSSALATLGIFERINTHEPENAPQNGYTAALWVDRIEPVLSSGLESTSVRVAFLLRLYTTLTQEPADIIDPVLLTNTDTVLAVFSGDFTLGGAVREVDLLGQFGPGLSAQAGYINIGGTMYRVMTVTLPLIVNDVWAQEA